MDEDLLRAARSLAVDDLVPVDDVLALVEGATRADLAPLTSSATLWLPLLEAQGEPPTRCRVSLAGHALLADPGHPLRLVNGDLHRGGTRPPFHPDAVGAALRILLDDPEADVTDVIGAPAFPGGALVDGDVEALLAGRPAGLTVEAAVAPLVDDHGRLALEVSGLPPGTHPDEVAATVREHVRAGRGTFIGWSDASVGPDPVSRWQLGLDAEPAAARALALTLPGMRARIRADLGESVARTLRRWMDDRPDDRVRRVAADLDGPLRPPR